MMLRSPINGGHTDNRSFPSGPVLGGCFSRMVDTSYARQTVRDSLDVGGGAEETSSSGTCPICVRPMSCSERLFAASCGYLCHLACMQRFSQEESIAQTGSHLCPVCFSPHQCPSCISSVEGHGLPNVTIVVSPVVAPRELLQGERRLNRSQPVSPIVHNLHSFDNRSADRGRQQMGSSISSTGSLETSPGDSSDLMALLAARDVINEALETRYPGLLQAPRTPQSHRELPPRRPLEKAASAPAQSFHDALRELGLARPGSCREENNVPLSSQRPAFSLRGSETCSPLFSPSPSRGLPPATVSGLRRTASLPLPPKTRPLCSTPREPGRNPGGNPEPTPRKQRSSRKYDSDSGGLPPVKETESGNGGISTGLRFREAGLETTQSVEMVTERLADFYRMTTKHGGRSNRDCLGAADRGSLAPLRLQRTKSM